MIDRELRQIKPYVQEWINASIAAARFGTTTTTGSVGGSTGSGFTETDALALFYTKTESNTWRSTHAGDEDAHHGRSHPFLGSDHTYTTTLGGEVLHDPDGLGLELDQLPHDLLADVGPDQHHARAHEMISTPDHLWDNAGDRSVPGTSWGSPTYLKWGWNHASETEDAGGLMATTVNGWVEVNDMTAATSVTTPLVQTEDEHLVFSPDTADGYDIMWDSDADLVSDNHVSGNSGILLRATDGLIDTYTIQVKELFAEAFTVQQKKAENGAIVITEGVTQLSRPFTIPTEGNTATIYVWDYQGLSGYDVMEAQDDVRLFFLEEAEIVKQAEWNSVLRGYDVGTVAGGPIHTDTFEGDSVGTNTGSEWFETGDENSTVIDDVQHEIVIPPSGGGTRGLADNKTGVNAHVHYNGASASTLTNYRVTGKIYLQTQWGITLFSGYLDGTPIDEYYRVRFLNSGTIHLDNHGGVGNGLGTTTSAFTPTTGTWYQFKAEVEDTGSQTEVRFKIWEDGDTEPGSWLIDAYDDTAGRRTEGTFGFWSYNGAGAANTWTLDEVDAETLTITSGTYASVGIGTSSLDGGDIALVQVCAETTDINDIVISGPGLTLVKTQQHGDFIHGLWWRRIVADSGGDGSWTFSLSNGKYGSMSFLRARVINGVVSGTPVESFVGTGGVDVTTRTQAAMSGLTNGFGAFTFVAQHNTNGQAIISDSPNNYYNGVHRSSNDAPNLQLEYRHTLDETSTPSITWTAATPRDFSLIAVAIEPTLPIAGGLSMGSAWGTITAESVVSTEPDEQAWVWQTRTNSPGQGVTVGIDAAILNYGDYDDGKPHGVIELTTLDQAGSPHLSFYEREQYDSVLGRIPLTLIGRIGVLDGIAGYGPDERGMVFVGAEGGYPGEFAITTAQMNLQNIPVRQTDNVGDPTVDIIPGEGLTIHTGQSWDPGDYERRLTFKDSNTGATMFNMAPYDLGNSFYMPMVFDLGSNTPSGGAYNWAYFNVDGDGASQRLRYSVGVYQTNPSSYAYMQISVADEIGVNRFDFLADDFDFDARGEMRIETTDGLTVTTQNTAIGAEVSFTERDKGGGSYDTVMNINQVEFSHTNDGLASGGLKLRNDDGDLVVFRADETYNLHLRYAWFKTAVFSAEGVFMASNNNDSADNIDHLWHDDAANRWHFVSDSTYKANGNSQMSAGSLLLKTDPTHNSALSGYNRIYVNSSGDLVVTFANNVTKTLATN